MTTVDDVLAEFNFDDGVVNAGDEDARRMATEIAQLREVLVFADGAILYNNRQWGDYEFVLADLYNETTPLQGVIRRAGCHERRKFLNSEADTA